MSNFVSIWDLAGVEHKMTIANAMDMERNVGWTRSPIGVEPASTPVLGPDGTPEIYKRGPLRPVETVAVFDKSGTEHQMDVNSAMDMVRHLGWTTSSIRVQQATTEAPPATVPTTSPTFVAPEDKIDNPVNLDAIGEPASAPREEAPVDVTTMTRDQLAQFAESKLGMSFTDDVDQQAILDAVLAEIE